MSFDLLNFYHRRLTLFGVDSRALTVTDSSKLLAAITPEFESGRLQPSPMSKRGTLAEVCQLYAFVDRVETARQYFLLRLWTDRRLPRIAARAMLAEALLAERIKRLRSVPGVGPIPPLTCALEMGACASSIRPATRFWCHQAWIPLLMKGSQYERREL